MLARDLLEALAGGDAVSGAVLARKAGVTRAAVWKQIEALRLKGVPVEAKVGGGYRLPWPIELLDGQPARPRREIEERQGGRHEPQPIARPPDA